MLPSVTVTADLPYDLSGLGQLATDTVFVTELLELFVARVPSQAYALQMAAARADWPTVGRLAHTLKSSFAILGIEPATGQLRQLERLAATPSCRVEALNLLAAVATVVPRYCDQFERQAAGVGQLVSRPVPPPK